MKLKNPRMHGLAMLAILAVVAVGCNEPPGKVVTPNPPPLSAEAAKAKAEMQQKTRLQSLQGQRKRSGK